MHPDNKILSFVVITEPYRRFHTHFIRGVILPECTSGLQRGDAGGVQVAASPRNPRIPIYRICL